MGSAVNLSTEKINHGSMMNQGVSTISHDQIHPHQHHQTNSELQAATISPVQSWNAGVILDHLSKGSTSKRKERNSTHHEDGRCSPSS